jgi:hypothetical protein
VTLYPQRLHREQHQSSATAAQFHRRLPARAPRFGSRHRLRRCHLARHARCAYSTPMSARPGETSGRGSHAAARGFRRRNPRVPTVPVTGLWLKTGNRAISTSAGGGRR